MQWTQTEAETWEALARAIDRGGRIHPQFSYRWGQARTWGGICNALAGAWEFAGMPSEQYGSMYEKIVLHGRRRKGSAYRWPLTPDGDRQRADFCRRMATLARRNQS